MPVVSGNPQMPVQNCKFRIVLDAAWALSTQATPTINSVP